MHCPQCQAENPEQAKFCLACGARLQAACPHCGTLLPPRAIFCTECGSRIGRLATPAPAPGAPPAEARLAAALKRLVPDALAERLLATRGQVGSERRLVTILFSDVKGSTAMAEQLDPEEVMEIMNGAFEVLISPVVRHEGTLARLMGDAILAFFGAPLSHEDDAARAVRAGLEIVAGAREYAARLEQERGITGFGVRVGINTGLVVVGEVGSDLRVEYTAMGDAINLAARMEQNAPVGGVLIAPETYRLVRGLFDVEALAPVAVKGKSGPVAVHLVHGVRPRISFWSAPTRGVEGVETPLVGRDVELLILQDYWRDVLDDGRTRVMTLLGDAGVGKSRLLLEFEGWLEGASDDTPDPLPIEYFRGQATAERAPMPYGLLRNLLATRCDIRETDSAAATLDKLRGGMAAYLSPDRVDLVGQLAGFDLRAAGSQAVDNLLGSDEFMRQATHALHTFFRAVAEAGPGVILLEDIHWADDASLDLVHELVAAQPDARRLIVCLARPQLLERRPNWGEGRQAHARLDLKPLSRRHSRALVDRLLGRVPDLPAELRGLIVNGAEGNPYYLEELVKMLIDDGVIVRAAEGPWQVDAERLAGLRVPPTLTGVLQARLDSLPVEERETLQRASVVGCEFWDVVVAKLGEEPPAAAGVETIHASLDSLRSRAMVFQREHSAIAGACEYVFKHTVLRDVIYESVLLKTRRTYHARVAEWLAENAGERLNEYLRLIARHYELAGDGARAAEFLRKAGKEASEMSLHRQALELFEHALRLAPPGDAVPRGKLLTDVAGEHEAMDDYQAARAYVTQALTLAREARDWEVEFDATKLLAVMAFGEEKDRVEEYLATCLALARVHGDRKREADALLYLASQIVVNTGRWEAAQALFLDEVEIRKELGAHSDAAQTLIRGLAMPAYNRNQLDESQIYVQEALDLLERIEDRKKQAEMLDLLGDLAASRQDDETAERHYLASLDAAREIGNKGAEASALRGLAGVARRTDRYPDAERYTHEAMDLCRDIGNRFQVAKRLESLGLLAMLQGQYAQAMARFEESLAINREIGERWGESTALGWLGHLHAVMGQPGPAWHFFRQALGIAVEMGNTVATVRLLVLITGLMANHGDELEAAQVLGLVLSCSDMLDAQDQQVYVAPTLETLRQALPADELEAALERGKSLDVEQTVAELLASGRRHGCSQ